MACINIEEDGVQTLRAEHDPSGLEFAVDIVDRSACVMFRQCKRCHVLYRPMEPTFIEKPQDGTTGELVDEPLSLPMAQAVSLTDMLDAAPVAEISQDTARRLLATVRAWYPRIMCDESDCEEESWSPFRRCEKHESEHQAKARAVDTNPEKMGGSPCVAGTRVPVRGVLDYLAEGFTHPQIVDQYPSLTLDKIKRAIEWTAEAIEGFPDQPPPKPSAEKLRAHIENYVAMGEDVAGLMSPDPLLDPAVLTWLRYQAEAE